MILSPFFHGHGAEWSKIFLYGQLGHAKMSRFEQKLDAANVGKEQNSQICDLLQLAQAEKREGTIHLVRTHDFMIFGPLPSP